MNVALARAFWSSGHGSSELRRTRPRLHDDFFAGRENMAQPGRGEFIEGSSPTAASGWTAGKAGASEWPVTTSCVIELGSPRRGYSASTSTPITSSATIRHSRASRGSRRPKGTTYDELDRMAWRELPAAITAAPGFAEPLRRLPREAGSSFTHVRLHIYPDGGAARFRVYGRVIPWWVRLGPPNASSRARPWKPPARGRRRLGRPWPRSRTPLLSLAWPGRVLRPYEQPAPARTGRRNMGDGWETRRKRQPGHDWILIALAAPGLPRPGRGGYQIHFKGNYPDWVAPSRRRAVAGSE